MKVTRKDAPIVIPPPTFVIELTAAEASTLMRVCNYNLSVADAVYRQNRKASAQFIAGMLGAMYSALAEVGVKVSE